MKGQAFFSLASIRPMRETLIDATCLEVRVAQMDGERCLSVDHFPIVGPWADRLRPGDVVAARLLGRADDKSGYFADIGSEEGFLRSSEPVPAASGELFLAIVAASAHRHKRARLSAKIPEQTLSSSQGQALLNQTSKAGRLRTAMVDHLADALQPEQSRTVQGLASLRSFLKGDTRSTGEIDEWVEPGLLFDAKGVTDALARSLAAEVQLQNGVRLVIEQTEAFASLDIDTAKAVAATSLEIGALAHSILDEIAIRGLSGQIIIDCPVQLAKALLETMKALLPRLSSDSTVRSGGGGLIVITRPRRGPSLAETHLSAGLTHLLVAPVRSDWATATQLARDLAFNSEYKRGRMEIAVSQQFNNWLTGEGAKVWEVIAGANPLLTGRTIAASHAADQIEIRQLRTH